jgi:hypothetical protein
MVDFDFGRLPVLYGRAIGTHDFVLQNNTHSPIKLKGAATSCQCVEIIHIDEILPPDSTGKISIKIDLPATDLHGRMIELLVFPENEEIPPLKIKISGRAGFSFFLESPKNDFGTVFRNAYKEKSKVLYACLSGEKNQENFVDSIKTDNPERLEFVLKERLSKKTTDSIGEYFYHEYEILILLKINATTPLGPDVARLFITTQTGERKDAIFVWNVREKPIFDPGLFYLIQLAPRQERVFSITYNSEIGGKHKVFTTTKDNLKIVETNIHENSVHVTLKCIAPETFKADEILGELAVETEDGKRHVMPVIAS